MGHLQAFGLDVFEHEESVFFEGKPIARGFRFRYDSDSAFIPTFSTVIYQPMVYRPGYSYVLYKQQTSTAFHALNQKKEITLCTM